MKEILKTIIIALLIAVGVRTVMFEPFRIPSGSMIPTLLVGDFLFVSKYRYGYSQYSLMFAPIPFNGRIFANDPQRGDVVVFRNPVNGQNFIKRVVGLPGETIAVSEGRLIVNGTLVERTATSDPTGPATVDPAGFFIELLPPTTAGDDPYPHIIREQRDGGGGRSWRVPEGHYFMMGDNRDNSTDSRFPQVGFVPFENFIGKAEIIFFSINTSGEGGLIRFDRFFDRIR